MARIMIALNMSWNLYNFRAGLINSLTSDGHDVVAVAPLDNYSKQLPILGCRYVELPMENMGMNPAKDFLLFLRFFLLLYKERPDVLLCYTVKPNIYGSLAARIINIPVVNNITGLGAVFIKKGWLLRFVKVLYRLALSRSKKVFFHNAYDCQLFINSGLVQHELTEVSPGSGVDLKRFSLTPYPSHNNNDKFNFILIARMLWDKGVGEFVEAARQLKKRYSNTEFNLIGFLESKNPEAISRIQMNEWEKEGIVNYLGVTDDVHSFIAKSDCVVLPSYREGTPRSLLEAAAMGRPIITTDAIGCRDLVEDGVNGYICKIRDKQDLAEKMEKMIKLSPFDRSEMGMRGHDRIVREYDEKIVTEKYLTTIREILKI